MRKSGLPEILGDLGRERGREELEESGEAAEALLEIVNRACHQAARERAMQAEEQVKSSATAA